MKSKKNALYMYVKTAMSEDQFSVSQESWQSCLGIKNWLKINEYESSSLKLLN